MAYHPLNDITTALFGLTITFTLCMSPCMIPKSQKSSSSPKVGAHWQNDIAEVHCARTILLHAMTKWPSVITEDMWPFAIRHMVNFHNASILHGKNISPYTLFTGQGVIFLAKCLQDGDSYSKWKACCWEGVYIGNATCHAGHISPYI